MLALAAIAPAQGPGSARVVTAKGYLSVDAVKAGSEFEVAIALEVAEGYHINAHVPSLDYLKATEARFEAPPGLTIREATYPSPVKREFEFAPGTALAVHEGTATITATGTVASSLKPGDFVLRATVQVQACNDNLCLAPADLSVEIPVKIVGGNGRSNAINSELFAAAKAAQIPTSGVDQPAGEPTLVQFSQRASDPFAAALSSGSTVSLLVVIFVSGLLLNLTPCVYPIIPITIGFFVNQAAGHERRSRLGKSFAMAAMYVLGMAVTYSLLGVVAAKSGGLFGAALQRPEVLIGLAVLMVALSLS
jgi:thiol:disulfide interchange protein DsbD